MRVRRVSDVGFSGILISRRDKLQSAASITKVQADESCDNWLIQIAGGNGGCVRRKRLPEPVPDPAADGR